MSRPKSWADVAACDCDYCGKLHAAEQDCRRNQRRYIVHDCRDYQRGFAVVDLDYALEGPADREGGQP